MIPAPLDEELPSSSRYTRLTPGGVGLRVPGTLAYRHLAIRLVATACRAVLDGEWSDMATPDDAFTHEVVSAFGEAFNNVALHGYTAAAPGAIRVEVEWDEEKFVVLVIDRGRTFDLDNVSLPDLDAMQENGMGVFIMRTCMDEVDYRPGPPNVLRLVKLRRHGSGYAGGTPLPPGTRGEAPLPPGTMGGTAGPRAGRPKAAARRSSRARGGSRQSTGAPPYPQGWTSRWRRGRGDDEIYAKRRGR